MEAMVTITRNPQGMFLQTAIENKKKQEQQQNTSGNNGSNNSQNRSRWRSLFRGGTAAATDAAGAITILSSSSSSDNGCIGDNSDLSSSMDSLSNSETIIAGLKSEIVKISASH